MLLTRAIVRGVPSALNMAKSLLENPAIVSQTPPWAISLEVESYSKRSSAEVSQRPVIIPGTGGTVVASRATITGSYRNPAAGDRG